MHLHTVVNLVKLILTAIRFLYFIAITSEELRFHSVWLEEMNSCKSVAHNTCTWEHGGRRQEEKSEYGKKYSEQEKKNPADLK